MSLGFRSGTPRSCGLPLLKRSGKLLAALAVCLAVSTRLCTVCRADGGIAVKQAYTYENYIDVFTDGAVNTDEASLKVSNTPAEITDAGPLGEKNITVRTTLLIDSSSSVPADARGKIEELIAALIENTAPNEQYRLITFGEQVNVLQDFTSDRYDLSVAADKLEFKETKSKIYDAVYSTIPDMRPLGDEPCYYRTIIVTDGADNTATGVTKEELYLQLQDKKYPIDIVAVSSEKQDEPKKSLAAFSRVSGGVCANIYPDADVSEVMALLGTDNLYWIRASVPASLLDGSSRPVVISGGGASAQLDVRMSLYDAPAEETTVSSEKATETTASPTQTEIRSETEPAPEPEPEDENTALIIILAVSGAVIAAAAAAAVIFAVRKKSGKASAPQAPASLPPVISESEKTEFVGAEGGGPAQFTVRLSNLMNPAQSWTVSIDKDVIIGRSENAAVRLDEKSVSREQCKITLSNGTPEIVNLSRTNKTMVNGTAVGSAPLRSGDTLKFGRAVLHVDSVQVPDSAYAAQGAENDSDSGETISLF